MCQHKQQRRLRVNMKMNNTGKLHRATLSMTVFSNATSHVFFNVHMLLTGLQMRTASSPVISKAQSKPRLHPGKTTHHKNTGVFWEGFLSLVPGIICYILFGRARNGLETVEEFQIDGYSVHKDMCS